MGSDDRWARIREIFQEAMELPEPLRSEYVANACGEDKEMLREVETLVDSAPIPSINLDDCIVNVVPASDPEVSQIGKTHSHYRIVSLIGKGGMGLVYKAQDLHLLRPVAIKFLPSAYQLNVHRINRFREEAYNASRTNHPNIVTIYDIGSDDGQQFIAMEYVEGETLRSKLGKKEIGGGDLRVALRIAIQIAEALRAAHRVGVIHRDLKPENVMINEEGLVKILDFGLAKLLEDQPALTGNLVMLESAGATGGASVGTLEYMAPEQLTRQNIDRRVDIYSFGVLLHELVTGRRPPRRREDRLPLGRSTKEHPATYLVQYPARLRQIIEKCLQVIPDDRYGSVDSLLNDLLQVEERVRRESSRVYRWSVRAALAIPLLTLLVLVGYLTHRLVTRYPFRDSQTLTLPIQQPYELASISPDGRYLVYISHEQSLFNIWVRDLETSKERKLLRPSRNGYLWPTISPDSRHIYVSRINVLGSVKLGNQLIRINLETGQVEELQEGVDSPVSFSPDGLRITYATEKKGEGESGSYVMVSDRDGLDIRTIKIRKTPEFYTLDGPVWSPDGKTIAVTAGTTTKPLYYNVVGLDVQSGVERPLTNRQWGHVLGLEWLDDSVGMIISAKIRGTAPNHHLHYLDTSTGEDRQITSDDHDYFGKPTLSRQTKALKSRATRLVTIRRQIQTSFWFNTRENPDEFESYSTQVMQDGYDGMGLLDDGKVLYSSRLEDDENIWMADLKGMKWKLTNNRESNRDPVITPDGRSIIFSSSLSGNPRIHRIDIDGKNQRTLTSGRLDKEPEISPDGKWVIYTAENSRKRTIWRVPLAGGEEEQLTTLATESPTISPDGDWIACLYNEDKVPGKVAIMPAEGGEPVRYLILPRPNYPRYNYFRWSPDGKSLDYISLQDNAANIWRQPLNGDSPFKLTNFTGSLISDFEWSDDGRQLYCVRCTTVYEVVWMDQ